MGAGDSGDGYPGRRADGGGLGGFFVRGPGFLVVPAFVGRPASLVSVVALVQFIPTTGLHGLSRAAVGFDSRFTVGGALWGVRVRTLADFSALGTIRVYVSKNFRNFFKGPLLLATVLCSSVK